MVNTRPRVNLCNQLLNPPVNSFLLQKLVCIQVLKTGKAILFKPTPIWLIILSISRFILYQFSRPSAARVFYKALFLLAVQYMKAVYILVVHVCMYVCMCVCITQSDAGISIALGIRIVSYISIKRFSIVL